MKVSQLLSVMDKDQPVFINDPNEPIDNRCLYSGRVKGIKRDDRINEYHIEEIFPFDDLLIVFAIEQKEKGADHERKAD